MQSGRARGEKERARPASGSTAADPNDTAAARANTDGLDVGGVNTAPRSGEEVTAAAAEAAVAAAAAVTGSWMSTMGPWQQ